MPDVSVITPTFRRPSQLAEAIKSVLSQTGVSVEMLVIDDSPEGSGRTVVEDIADPRVQYYQMDPPTGGKPAIARNQGIARTTGKLVHFLDDDDIVADGAYAAFAAAFQTNPKAGVAFGRIEPFGSNAQKLAHERQFFSAASRRASRLAHLPNRRHLLAGVMLYLGTMLVCSGGLIRRSCLERTTGFDTECAVMEDVEFYTRAIRRFDCVFLDRIIVNYRIGDPSLMNDLEDEVPIERSYDQIYRRYHDEFGAREMLLLKILMRTVLARL